MLAVTICLTYFVAKEYNRFLTSLPLWDKRVKFIVLQLF